MGLSHSAADGARSAEHPLLRPAYRRWVVFVLLLVAIFNFADRAILAVLAQPIKEDLHLTDTDLGILQGLGFAILYSVLGVPLGMMAERVTRTRLLTACIVVWSGMTVACGFAVNFATMLLGRIGVGIGEAGAQPITNSLVSDHFGPVRRGSIFSLILLGSPIGFLLGQSVGGIVASEWGWRAAFYAMGVPGLIVAALVLFTLREPPRGLAEGSAAHDTDAAPSLMEVLRYLFAKPTFRHLLAGFVIGSFTMNAIANFVLPFYLRGFDIPLATMGVLFGVVSFFSNGLGMVLGGFGFDWLGRRDQRWVMWGPAIALLLCIPIYFGAFYSQAIYISLAFIFFGNMSLASFMAPTMASMQNMAGPRMRATTSAVTAMIIGIVGAGLGPTVVGILSDAYAVRLFDGADFFANCPGGRGVDGIGSAMDDNCLAASTDGLRFALISVLGIFAWAALHYWLAARTLKQDLYVPQRVSAEPEVGAAMV
ncbi:MFS family permease [Altererythrobacter atlanticus]|uniref:Hexuronate transporter n=1 Tax=Croceibacterium atlanticum TaxID=1267766 RepID=A0A0F7KQM8_9SPHN|nr:MFS transporter [Croceibacterium atlanticum]AKH41391.1 Hexuronate transporter [Croceibacterium atlanticum]MBB5732853.1 MFS family permease [Croceibacterium atlanticum]